MKPFRLSCLLTGSTPGLALLLASCGAPSQRFSAPMDSLESIQLAGAVAVLDQGAERFLFLTTPKPGNLAVTAFPAPENVRTWRTSPDLERLFVLSGGVDPRLTAEDEGPQLLVYDGASEPKADDRIQKRFSLDDQLENLALDPAGRWVAAYGGDASVVNPNELVLFDLEENEEVDGTALPTTIRSFGGAPLELLFTDELELPVGGPRRFLVVRTDRDVTLLDLEHLNRKEVTLRLTESAAQVPPTPLQIVYDDGDPDDPADALLAVRLEDSSDVVMATFGEPSDSTKDFSMKVNVVDVGGVPSVIDFVRTDGGLRLAALVPASKRAVLVDPGSTVSEVVDLPQGFSSMRKITDSLAEAPATGDVALLWGAGSSIGFWSLGSTSATPYRSVSTAQLSFAVTDVQDVPAPNERLKVLRGNSSDVFVLDLESRQSFPLESKFSSADVTVAPDGERLWVFQNGQSRFSAVELPDLHPRSLYVYPAVNRVHDIESADGSRSALALHTSSGLAVTLLDATDPSSAETKYFPALHLTENP